MTFQKSRTKVGKMISGLDLPFVVNSVACFTRKKRGRLSSVVMSFFAFDEGGHAKMKVTDRE